MVNIGIVGIDVMMTMTLILIMIHNIITVAIAMIAI